MKKPRKKLFTHIVNVIAIALIIECFLCSVLVVKQYGEKNCFERIDETTEQAGKMFLHAMNDNQSKLQVFANILGINDSNTDEYLQELMQNFCSTQYFVAACIHRANGSTIYYGEHPHNLEMFESYEKEVAKLPYTSNTIYKGKQAEERYVYQAVPVVRNGETVGILYGYLSLDIFPDFLESTAYDGKCHFYIVDGDSGDFMMDEYHGELGNIYDGSMEERESKKGYDMNDMRSGIFNGESGFHVFRSKRTGEWYYTCYRPIGINNWSIQLSIDEPTAFTDFMNVIRVISVLAACVVCLMFVHIIMLMLQAQHTKRKDKENLYRSNYISEIQRTLLNAHANTDMINHALKIIASEVKCETVLLLSFSDKKVNNVHYWPSADITAANEMMGRNIRNEFPMLYDRIASGESIIFDCEFPPFEISDNTIEVFKNLDIHDICIVPVSDHNGFLKGALCAVNAENKQVDISMLECVTYDFFMTLANVENFEIIRNLGTIDYMTHVKNRNSYETEISDYANANCESLWCMFVDVNGLHEINNTQGHKAGDLMLCAVADTVKRIFGKNYTYRIGGDEFLAFALDCTQEDMMRWKQEIHDLLARKGYYVSIGFKGILKRAQGIFEVERMIAEAEDIMYREKHEFYQKNNLSEDRIYKTR